jgi:thiamine kinase-like enzyme
MTDHKRRDPRPADNFIARCKAKPEFQFPELGELIAGLAGTLEAIGLVSHDLTILDRRARLHSAHPSEIVKCSLADGSMIQLFCKYDIRCGDGGLAYHCVSYEAQIYRHILQPLEVSVPRMFGAFNDASSDRVWLILEYLHKSKKIRRARQPDAMVEAASWIGRFHAAAETHIARTPTPFVFRHDLTFYQGFVRRTLQFSTQYIEHPSWLQSLCESAMELSPILCEPPFTIIHGQYAKHNILVNSGVISPIDWETAAIAAGEIDLTKLTDHYYLPEEVVQECKVAYRQARWPDGEPSNFDRRFELARLHTHFYSLGRKRRWKSKKLSSRLEALRSSGERLALI